MKAAKAWGVVPPSRFYEFSELDRAVMIQYMLDSEAMSAYQGEVDRNKHEEHMHNLKPGPTQRQ